MFSLSLFLFVKENERMEREEGKKGKERKRKKPEGHPVIGSSRERNSCRFCFYFHQNKKDFHDWIISIYSIYSNDHELHGNNYSSALRDIFMQQKFFVCLFIQTAEKQF